MGLNKIAMKPRIFILCNGELAEPLYFQDFKDHLRAHNIVIRYKKEFLRKAPWDFIKAAIKFKEELESKGDFVSDDGDQVWCVFDVDNYLDDNEKKFHEGLKLADENGLNIAWSNECFEFWFLSHFALHSSTIPRADYHKKLAKNFKDNSLGIYKKNMEGIFESLLPFQETGVKHAKKLYVKGEVNNNPSTAIHLLVEELLHHFG